MPDTLLNVLKFFLVALVWLFFLRAMRAVWVEVRSPVPAPSAGAGGVPGRSPSAFEAWDVESPEGPRLQPTVTGREVPVLELTVVAPADQAGDLYELTGPEAVIGRASGCAVPIEGDTFVSHLHARIFTRGTEFWAEDLGSTNGSFVNSKKLVSPVPLRPGDRLQVGRTILEVIG